MILDLIFLLFYVFLFLRKNFSKFLSKELSIVLAKVSLFEKMINDKFSQEYFTTFLVKLALNLKFPSSGIFFL